MSLSHIPPDYLAGVLDQSLTIQTRYSNGNLKIRGSIHGHRSLLSFIQSLVGGSVSSYKSIALHLYGQDVIVLARYLKSTPSLLQDSYQVLCDIDDTKRSFVSNQSDPIAHQQKIATLRTSLADAYSQRLTKEAPPRSVPYMAGYVEASAWLEVSLKRNSLFSAVLMTYKPGFQQRPPQLFGSRLIPFIEVHSPHMLFRRPIFEKVAACERVKNGSQNGAALYHEFAAFEEQHESTCPLTYAKTQEELNQEYENRRLSEKKNKLDIKQAEIAAKEEEKKRHKNEMAERRRIRHEQVVIRQEEEKKESLRKAKVREELRAHEIELVSRGQSHCRKCDENLPLASFCKAAHTHTGYNLYCKTCCREDHYLPNKEKYRERVYAWQKANPEKTKEAMRKQKAKPHNRIKFHLTKTVKEYLRGKGLLDTYRSLINCSPKQLVSHIESKFTPAMSWENYGTYWHLDHIIPCAAFDWVIKSHIHWCWDHRNLQPLPATENVIKSDSLPSGESARNLRETNMERLKEVVGPLLEQAGITTAAEYAKSWDEIKEPICLAI